MVVRDLVEALDRALKEMGYEPRGRVPKPVDSEARAKFCESFGGFLPREYLQLLEVQDGENYLGARFLFGEVSGEVLSAAKSLAEYLSRVNYAASEDGLDRCNGSYQSRGPVNPFVWSREWIPFMQRDVIWFIDMQPPSDGVVGQICFQDPENQRVAVVAASLKDLIAAQIWGIRNGARSIEDAVDL